MNTDVETAERDIHRSQAIRLLLASPMIGRDHPEFARVAGHDRWLAAWFADTCGWTLHVDPRRGFARLAKTGTTGSVAQPARFGSDRPFDRRGYVILCLLAAAVGEHPRPRISLRAAAEGVYDMSVRAGVPTFDPDNKVPERRALIRALRLLESLGMLSERDRIGQDQDYIQDRDATTNVLYDIDERRLALLISAPVAPAQADTWTGLLDTVPGGGDMGPDARRTRARHTLMRRLLDSAVCLVADLDDEERRVMAGEVSWITARLAEAGLAVERRAEYWAAVDTDAWGTGWALPKDTIPTNAAMLLLDRLIAEPDACVGDDGAVKIIQDLLESHPTWAKTWRGGAQPQRLAAAALALLQQSNLISGDGNTWRPSPAAIRWRVHLIEDDPPAAELPEPLNAEPLFEQDFS